jgi:transposase
MINELVIQGHSVKNICRLLHINRSQYYRQRQSSKDIVQNEHRRKKREEVLDKILKIKSEHPFWGYRRTRAYLQYKEKIRISRKYVYRLMKENALLVDVKQYKAKRRPPDFEHPRKRHVKNVVFVKFYAF